LKADGGLGMGEEMELCDPKENGYFFGVGKCIFRPLRHRVEMFMKPVG
jgi:hypothetical protein